MNLQDTIFFAQCEENSILYAGTFFGDCKENLIYASGTVFNEILIWKINDSNIPIKLMGHDGVIFKIKFDSTGENIASVSDDRSIRIWSLIENQSKMVLWGHFARIWDCEFIGSKHLASISEDYCCRIWNLETQQCISCLEGHRIKNIWSLAINHNHTVLATGGADSSIKLWNLESIIKNTQMDSQLVLTSLPQPYCNDPKDFIRNFAICDKQNFILVSHTGNFFLFNSLSNQISHIYHDDDFAHSCMFNVDACSSLVVAGSLCGKMLLIDPSFITPIVKIQIHVDKIINLYITSTKDSIREIVTNSLNGDLGYTRFKIENGNFILLSKHQFFMRDNRKCFLDVKFIDQGCRRYIIIAGRSGSLEIFFIENIENIPNELISILTVKCAHNHQAVTSITELQASSNDIMFATSGRDGALAYWSLNCESEQMQDIVHKSYPKTHDLRVIRYDNDHNLNFNIERYNWTKLSKGIIEKVYNVQDNIFAVIFLKTFMILFNVSKNYQVLQIDCGGSTRRSSICLSDLNIDNCNFGFIRKKHLCTFKQSSNISDPFQYPQLLSPIHAREIRDIEFIPLSGNIDLKIIVTASEDCSFEFHSCKFENSSLYI